MTDPSFDHARQMLESIPDAFLAMDLNWRFTYLNSKALKLLDGESDELMGRGVWESLPGFLETEFEEVCRRVADQGVGDSAEVFCSEHGKCYEVHAQPARDGVFVYLRDITMRTTAGEVLRRSEEKYRTLFDSIDEGFCLIEVHFDEHDKPTDYRFLEVNPAFERHTGLKNATGKTARELVPELDESWFSIYGGVALTGKPARFENHAPAMGRWFDVCAVRLGDPLERRVALIFNDISHKKAAENALRLQNSQLQTLYDLSDAAQRATGVAEMCERAMDGLLAATQADRASVLLFDADDVMRFKAWRGLTDEYRSAVEGHTPWKPTDADAQPFTVGDVLLDDELKPYRNVFEREGIRALGFVPLVDSGRVLGKFMVYYDQPHRFSIDELAVCRAIAASIAFSINRARGEEALRRERDLVRTIAENSASALAMMDVHGFCTYANRALLDMTDYLADEIVSRPLHDLIHHHYPDGRPYPMQDCPIVRALPENVNIQAHEDVFFRKDGSSFPVLCAASPITVDGNPVSTVIEFRDMTAEKESEAALREGEKRFRSTFENAAVGIAHVGLDGGWLRVNERLCEIVGYAKEEMLEMTFQDITHPDDLEGDLALLDRLVKAEIPNYQLEKRYIRRDGNSVWINLTVSMLRSENADPAYFIAVIEDITDRKNSAEALRRSEQHLRELSRSLEERVARRTMELQQQTARLRSLAAELASTEQRERKRLAAVLHDDLQQLLVAAKIHLLDSRRHLDSDAAVTAVDEAVQRIGEAVAAARDLTRQLRPPTLYEAGLISALDWLSSEMAERHRLRVVVDADREALPLSDDIKAFLFDCIRELLFNVVKYAGVHEAFVKVRMHGRSLQLVVMDEGRGFEADGISKDRSMGGFGLFSVRERLTAFGGSMTITSAPGKGTRVELIVPLSSAMADEHDAAEVPLLGGRSEHRRALEGGPRPDVSGAIRLFIVDDHAMVREGLANILETDERMVVIGEAADGIEAVQYLKHHQADVVLLDLNMPRMNGVETAREIRRKWPATRIIGISVQGDHATARTMLEAGANAFISKSGDSEHMIKTILDVVRTPPRSMDAVSVQDEPAGTDA